MCRGKRTLFHHRRHGHGGCRGMKRHGGKFHHEKHFDGPSRRCHHEGSPNKEHQGKNHCMFGRKNHQIPHHDFGAEICERSSSPRTNEYREQHRFGYHGPSHRPHHHHHRRHGHGRRFFHRRFSAEF